LGVFVKIEASHFCIIAKEKTSKPAILKTICMTGEFKKEANAMKLNLILK
jgi:GTP cyclohydrolase I